MLLSPKYPFSIEIAKILFLASNVKDKNKIEFLSFKADDTNWHIKFGPWDSQTKFIIIWKIETSSEWKVSDPTGLGGRMLKTS